MLGYDEAKSGDVAPPSYTAADLPPVYNPEWSADNPNNLAWHNDDPLACNRNDGYYWLVQPEANQVLLGNEMIELLIDLPYCLLGVLLQVFVWRGYTLLKALYVGRHEMDAPIRRDLVISQWSETFKDLPYLFSALFVIFGPLALTYYYTQILEPEPGTEVYMFTLSELLILIPFGVRFKKPHHNPTETCLITL